MKEPGSYLVNGFLACAVMYFVLRLSSSGRGPIDWAVISLVAVAIAWNLFKLGRRLYSAGGGKGVRHLLRTLLFWALGLMNTALIRPRDLGSWKNIAGWALLATALIDSIALYRKERSPIS